MVRWLEFSVLRRLLLICWIVLLTLLSDASLTRAQDSVTSRPIVYGEDVSGEISDGAFFDHWQLNARAGARIYVRMTGANGLAPLIGILSEGGTLLTRSANGMVDSTVDLNFDIPADGTYIIVATRVDNEFGTTTGAYTLRVDWLNPPPTRDPRFQDVTFPCGSAEATAAATIHFAREDTDNGAYSLRVYGFDGFQPVIRVQSGEHDDCITTPADAAGDVVTFPGERPITITEADLSATVQHVINSENADPASITVMIGSLDGQPGRYVALIGGFAIEPSTDRDVIDARLAPRPAQGDTALLVYAIGVNNRLDPSVIIESGRCDDAGRRGCEDVPAIADAGVILNNGVRVVGDRFDAGVLITDTDPHTIQILSFSGTTHGEYALLLIGELPPVTN